MKLPLENQDGSGVDVFPARLNDDPSFPWYETIECPRTAEGYLDSRLCLNEDTIWLVSVFLKKYLDRELLPQYRDMDIKNDSFDNYGDNLYRYSDLRRMLGEIRNTAQAIVQGRTTESIRQMIPYHDPSWYGLYGKVDEAKLFDEHRREIADYLLRFCDAVQAVMDHAPEFDLLDFQGP